MVKKYKAYCRNSRTGFGFSKELPQYNLLTNTGFKNFDDITGDSTHMYKIGNPTITRVTGYPQEWNFFREVFMSIDKNEGVMGQTGLVYETNYSQTAQRPNLTQGSKYGVSCSLVACSPITLKVNLTLLYGNSELSVGAYDIEPWERLMISKVVTLPTTETTQKFGLKVTVEETEVPFRLFFEVPKVEPNKVTSYQVTPEEYNSYKEGTEMPYVGWADTPSDNFDDYVWGGMFWDDDFDPNCGVVKQEATWVYARPIAQRTLIGVDNDIYDSSSGRSIEFSVIKANKNIFDMTGNNFNPEQYQDSRQRYNVPTLSWIDNSENLHVVAEHTAIDVVAGEISNNCIEANYYKQAAGNCRIDETVRSAIFNAGFSMGQYFVSQDFAREVDVMRETPNEATIRISADTTFSSMNDLITTHGRPQGFIFRPYSINQSSQTKIKPTATTIVKGISIGWSMRDWVATAYSQAENEDWFREFENQRTRAFPNKILFVNMPKMRAWLCTPDGMGWKKSAEYTISGSATGLLRTWNKIVPQDGQMFGNIVFTDKVYTDYPTTASDSFYEDIDFIFPEIQYNNVKFDAHIYTNPYNTKYMWWAKANLNTYNRTYGACQPVTIDFNTSLCTIERIKR